ncbi:hypothetical protein K437DRAFT_242616 [Tilletiaria anomala UBC 951]|uniref:R3H domain-containing protein n=1 Tax=Tilletiaria anomala (strain ATCC 24038 / CBS 436.72 / UBC 951) TaxID=1037660 RepID=A0A066WGN8_TILAU|nr:uncharacterized protein K437DRAFT_242616 [Tilletiaria anomala UBC 951]KDN53167.1 hypothetical protein K437DRAFT_242616 [Tilletiaria anomala UBC 951]
MSNESAHLTPGVLNPAANSWQPQTSRAAIEHGQGCGPIERQPANGKPARKSTGRTGRGAKRAVNGAPSEAQQQQQQQTGQGKGRNRGKSKPNAQRKPELSLSGDSHPNSTTASDLSDSALASKAASRRQKFGTKLTSSDKPTQPARRPPDPSSAFPLRDDYPDLRSRLIAELSHGQYDCVICYSTVATRQPVWSCSQCSAVLHLNCAKQWAERSVKQMEEQNAMQENAEIRARRGTWRCPSCQYAREDVPHNYWCWCGRVMDPSPQNTPPGSVRIPHGCGQKCTKGNCAHACTELCHPAACPPCPVTVSRRCFCGKKTVTIRCSQLTRTSRVAMLGLAENGLGSELGGISCTDVCGKALNCGVHTCQSVCHAGKCGDCTVTKEANCYCGRDTKIMLCGQGQEIKSYSIAGDESWDGYWSCEQLCERKFDCRHHACKRTCHPLSRQAATCSRSPSLVSTCPCGATSVAGRTSCTDAIPTCQNTCKKDLPCDHQCVGLCHAGDCAPCAVPTTRPCRCGEAKQTLVCSARQAAGGGEQDVLCKMVCKALRNCGKHQCNRQCCPLYFQAKSKSKKRPTPAELEMQDPMGFHACDVPCGKPLSCKLHSCERSCHRGPCGRCLQSSFEEAVCHCGRTVMEPPIQCGTQIQCNFPCTRPPPPCGHPPLPHNCHQEEDCPPCVYLTDRLCHCKKTVVPNVPCSRTNVHCGVQCGSVLGCGFHRCQGVCHQAPADCGPCTQMCGKPRKLCGHACPTPCHAPGMCPETEACQALTVLQCGCGHVQQKVKCGVSMHKPNAERSLKCNDSCAIAQRNAKMAEALGLSVGDKAGPTQYPDSVLAFYASRRKEAEQVEQLLTDFIKSPRHGTILPVANKEVRQFTHELATCYGLASESVDEEPRRSVMLRRGGGGSASALPTRSLNDAWKEKAAESALLSTSAARRAQSVTLTQLRRQPSAGVSAPASATPLSSWNSFILEGVFGQDEASLRAVLSPRLGEAVAYGTKWLTHEDVLVHPVLRAAMGTAAIDAAGRAIVSAFEPVRSLCGKSSSSSGPPVARALRPATVDLLSPSLPVLRRGSSATENRAATGSAWSSHVLLEHAVVPAAVRSAPVSGRATPMHGYAPSGGGPLLMAAAAARGQGGAVGSPSPPPVVPEGDVPDSWDDSV